MAKKTPLYEEHLACKGNVVDYAGWMLPVEYEGLVPEHNAVRNAVGIFDVSHMGEIVIKGKDALKFVDYMTTNDVKTLGDGKCIYCFFLQDDGGVVDDLIVYKYSDDYFYLVVNASNCDKDYKWLCDNKGDYDVEILNISDDVAEVAVQGPKAQATLQKLTDTNLDEITFFTFKDKVKVAGVECLVSRTGYTGEDGFEVYSDNKGIVTVWREILKAGEEFGIKPCGLGCRDTLRFEAALPLYGNELSDVLTPIEAGLKFFVAFNKDSDFKGKAALQKKIEEGTHKKLIGLELKGAGVARSGYKVLKGDKEIGFVTTGYPSPTLGKTIANVMVDPEEAVIGNEVQVLMRKKPVDAVLISKRYLAKK